MNGYLRTLCQWSRVYGEVEHRLEEAGAFDSLQHLHGMSQSELDLLVQRELDHPIHPRTSVRPGRKMDGEDVCKWPARWGNSGGPSANTCVRGVDEVDVTAAHHEPRDRHVA